MYMADQPLADLFMVPHLLIIWNIFSAGSSKGVLNNVSLSPKQLHYEEGKHPLTPPQKKISSYQIL